MMIHAEAFKAILTESKAQSASSVLSGHRPCAVSPERAEPVREVEGGRSRDLHKLTFQALPEIESVLLGLQCSIR